MPGRHFSQGAVTAVLLCAFVAILLTGLLVAFRFQPSPDSMAPDAKQQDQITDELPVPHTPSPEPELIPEPEPPPVQVEPTEPATPEPTEPPVEPIVEIVITSLPVRMRIPALSLDYEIQGTGADASGTMQIVPAREITSWFTLSAIPGNRGNAILGGHNTWRGTHSRLFTLDALDIGDEMEIEYADGTSLKFFMESVFVYPLKTAPAHLIMDVRGEARVTLITCKGPYNSSIGTSDNRIVAIFKEESVFVIPDPPVEPFPPRVLDSEGNIVTEEEPLPSWPEPSGYSPTVEVPA